MAAVANGDHSSTVQQKLNLMQTEWDEQQESFAKEQKDLDDSLADLKDQVEKAQKDKELTKQLEQELQKLKDEKIEAERKCTQAGSLVVSAEKDQSSKATLKIIQKLQTELDKAKSSKESAETRLADKTETMKTKKDGLIAQAKELEESMSSEKSAFEKKLADFKKDATESKIQLAKQLEELRQEHSLARDNWTECSESLAAVESNLASLEADVKQKKEELASAQAEYTKKLTRAREDSAFLKKELSRVKVESDRKIAQLQELKLENILDELRKNKETETMAVKQLEFTSGQADKELADAETLHQKILNDHAVVSESYSTKKDTILAEIEKSRQNTKENEKRVEEIKSQIADLEESSWNTNALYAEKIEHALNAANNSSQSSAPSSGKKKKGKKAVVEEVSPQQKMKMDQEAELKRVQLELEKEKQAKEQLTSKIDQLDREFRAEKKKREKLEKAAKQGGKSSQTGNSKAGNSNRDNSLASRALQQQKKVYENANEEKQPLLPKQMLQKARKFLAKNKPAVISSVVLIVCGMLALTETGEVLRQR
ncbi:unnamed protein product [Amoebophrya sp. A120]|nr:unnamed protein product [Amoebophrya sp. A120]|eukprot:GSA120T00006868001.1